MRRLGSVVAVFLLVVFAAPLLACVVGSPMTHEESACCRAMHGHCGDLAMTACCPSNTHTHQHDQLVTLAPIIHVDSSIAGWLDSALGAARSTPPALLRMPDDHSPPGLLTAETVLLRI